MEHRINQVVEKLQRYNESKRKLALLEFELATRNRVTANEMLETMVFRSSAGEHVTGTGNSGKDKMIHIALNYSELAEKENMKAYKEILNEWYDLHSELGRMDLCLSLLDERLEKVPRYIFFERKTWREIEETTGLSRRTIIRRKQEALEALTEMYSYTQDLISR